MIVIYFLGILADYLIIFQQPASTPADGLNSVSRPDQIDPLHPTPKLGFRHAAPFEIITSAPLQSHVKPGYYFCFLADKTFQTLQGPG
jgi:hypothetical protein